MTLFENALHTTNIIIKIILKHFDRLLPVECSWEYISWGGYIHKWMSALAAFLIGLLSDLYEYEKVKRAYCVFA